jgi:hypothetical protein
MKHRRASSIATRIRRRDLIHFSMAAPTAAAVALCNSHRLGSSRESQ